MATALAGRSDHSHVAVAASGSMLRLLTAIICLAIFKAGMEILLAQELLNAGPAGSRPAAR
jgi:hypothetical protein